MMPKVRSLRHLSVIVAVIVAAIGLVAGVATGQPVATTAPTAAKPWKPVWEHWYVLELADVRAGWMRETVTSRDEKYRTESVMVMKISRGPVELEISMSSEFIETRDGRPVQLRFGQDMAVNSVDTLWVFGDDAVMTTSKQRGRVIEREQPLPAGPWLTPVAAHRYLVERMEAGAKSMSYRTIQGDLGLEPVTLTFEFLRDDEMETAGRTLPVTVWKTTISAMPGTHATAKVSADGHLLHKAISAPFGRLVTRIATEAEARAEIAGAGPELMVRTFVAVDRPIRRARATRTATLRLRTREGDMPVLPSAGAQRFEPGPDPGTATVHSLVDRRQAASAAEAADLAYVEATTMVDSGDPLIRKLVASACRKAGDDPHARVEAMRRCVHEHIGAKSLDQAFATASETAILRTGDCSEHAVLLCAMIRADGIPSRVASGLVYADRFAGEQDIFGWHMWTQALIDGNWVDFDATLPRRFDAAHILTGTSSLAEGIGAADMASVVTLMGNLEVEVVEVGYE